MSHCSFLVRKCPCRQGRVAFQGWTRSGATRAWIKGKVITSQPVQFLENIFSEDQNAILVPLIDTRMPGGALRRAHVEVLWGGKQKQVATAAAPGLHEAAARKKKVPMNYFCPPQKICPRIFSAYTE